MLPWKQSVGHDIYGDSILRANVSSYGRDAMRRYSVSLSFTRNFCGNIDVTTFPLPGGAVSSTICLAVADCIEYTRQHVKTQLQ